MRYAIWNEYVAVEVDAIERPRDDAEVAACVVKARSSGRRIKAVGAGHSFNDLSLTEHVLVDLRQLSRILAVDLSQGQVRVQGGMPLSTLVRALAQLGLALPNIGAWTEQTLAGVLSTATHGTGGRYRDSLIEAALEVTLVDGRGELRVLRGHELRYLTLGFFGIITEVLLRCVPLFWVHQSNLLMDGEAAIDGLGAELAAHDFVDLRWAGNLPRTIVRRWDVVPGPATLADRASRLWEGVRISTINRLLSVVNAGAMSRAASSRMFGTIGRLYIEHGQSRANTSVWYEGLTFNSLVAAPHEEREFALPLSGAADALHALRTTMLDDPASVSLEIQVRFSPAVDVRLAPNHGRDTVWFNLNVLDRVHSAALVDRLSHLVYEHGARPHWAKVIPACTPDVVSLYGDDALAWERRRRSFDPDGVFLNAFYERELAPGLLERPTLDLSDAAE